MFQLYPFQNDAVTRIRAAFGLYRGVLFQLPTGGGKTVIFTEISRLAEARGSRVYIVAHRKELIDQTHDALSSMGVAHGVISPDYPNDLSQPVQVASVQTLARRIRSAPQDHACNLLIVDEAHHCATGTMWSQVVDHMNGARLLGVTATPERLDGKGLGAAESGGHFNSLITGPGMLELIELGRLARPVVYAPPSGHIIDDTNYRKRGGDFRSEELAEQWDKPTITGDVIAHYRQRVDRRPALVFCAGVKHAGHVQESFAASGYQAAVLTGKTPTIERARMIQDLGRNHLNVLTSCETVCEGTDIPAVHAAILLRATASLGLYMQQVGRALRVAEGKDKAVILDHVGNTHRHGFPTLEREWSLAGRPKKKKDEATDYKVRQCPECYAVHKASAGKCPECGHVYTNPFAEQKFVDGQLVEVTPETAPGHARLLRARKEVQACENLADLIALGVSRGYAHPKGWARNLWRRQIRQIHRGPAHNVSNRR